MAYSVFEYMYRDASNYKSFGVLWISGSVNGSMHQILRRCLECDDMFIAEQVNIEPLYQKLFHYSNGRTIDDHSWHTFLGFRPEKRLPKSVQLSGYIKEFVDRFVVAGKCWDPALSPNFQ